jgi:serine/threonine-protein kinase
MGVVYRAYHAQLERVGAVKVLQGLAPDPDSAARFRREAQSIAHLRHPNIVNVFDFGEFEGTPYMIVEFVEGGSLANVVKSGPLERKAMLGYLHGIASALDYAHSRGIVHRDVKPANVLLGAENTPILADFGLAKLMESSSIKSLTGVTTGTPAYMAPEQVTASQVGPAADRYSLAVMAYEMLTGFLPFDQGGVLEVLYAQVHRVPDAPSSRSAKLGPQVDAVVMRGLAKDPAARWESCAAFVLALEGALSARKTQAVDRTVVFAPPVPVRAPATIPHRAVEATSVVDTAGAIRGPDAAIAQHPPRRRSKRPFVYAAIGAVALILILLLGTGAYFVITRPPTLDVSHTTVSPGDGIVVTASHVPRNQSGNIELHSLLQTYPFKADGNGNVRGTIFLPNDLDLGTHTLRLCWSGVCRAQVILHVVAAGVAEVNPGASPPSGGTPTPGSSPSPGTSPSAGSTPRSTPSSRPVGGSSPTPTHAPSPTPRTSPTPTVNPCPTPAPPATLSPSSQSVALGGKASFSGSNFTPNTQVTLKYYKASVLTTTWYVISGCTGKFATSVTTASGILRTDKVTACDLYSRCASATITIIA